MVEELKALIDSSKNRNDLWVHLVNKKQVEAMAELGVYRGHFAEDVLRRCESVSEYIMIDPWRNLEDWNKPANEDDQAFEAIYREAMKRTEFAVSRRAVLRGKTMEVIEQIENGSLDFVYIDADHTLKGITIDLINIWPKVKRGGLIGGDDFGPSIWQHGSDYEPTMVFPYTVYFAEAVGAKLYALPFNQFLMIKEGKGFEFIDLTDGKYSNTGLRGQLEESPIKFLKRKLRRR